MRITNTIWLCILALGLVSGAHAEPTMESFRSGASADFTLQFSKQAFPKFTPAGNYAAGDSEYMKKFELFLKERIKEAPRTNNQVSAQAGKEVASLDLKALKNRHISQSSLRYTLGGETVVVSGAFDREQEAFVSIKVGDKAPVFYNVRGLMDKEEIVKAGGNSYLLYLSPNIIRPMKSQIVLENEADEDEQVRISIKKLLAALSKAGDSVVATGQTYSAFYYDDIKGNTQDPKSQSFAFVLTDENNEFHVFLVPAELVVEEEPTRFKMHKNKALWLQLVGGNLKITE